VDELAARTGRAIRQRLRLARRHLDHSTARLEALSPLAVLGRGYSLTVRVADGRIVRDAAELAPGDEIRTRLAHGHATSRVQRIEP
jgi:exodeoxyribonuclease VII large subunit